MFDRVLLKNMDPQDAYEIKYQKLLVDIKDEFPEFDIINKKYSKFSQMLGKLSFWNKEFNSLYSTTIGPKIYHYGGSSENRPAWSERSFEDKYFTMLHERIHMRQMRDVGGLIPFFFVFGLIPLPAKLAYFRMKWEMEAYEIDIYHSLKKRGRNYVLGPKYRKFLLDQFCGPFYMWMWYDPDYIMDWLEHTVSAIETGNLTFKKLIHRRFRPKATSRDLKSPWLLKLLYPDEFSRGG